MIGATHEKSYFTGRPRRVLIEAGARFRGSRLGCSSLRMKLGPRDGWRRQRRGREEGAAATCWRLPENFYGLRLAALLSPRRAQARPVCDEIRFLPRARARTTERKRSGRKRRQIEQREEKTKVTRVSENNQSREMLKCSLERSIGSFVLASSRRRSFGPFCFCCPFYALILFHRLRGATSFDWKQRRSQRQP